jgi:polar amino acid transport system substrate-binding protein
MPSRVVAVGSRRWLALALAGMALVSGVWLGALAGAASLPTLRPGVLTVGVDVPTPGLAEPTLRNGTVVSAHGFEPDLAAAVARHLHLRLDLIEAPFAQTFTPGAKPFDVALEHVTITPQRARAVDFSRTYFVTNKGVLLANGVTQPKSLAELRKLRLCAQSSTTSIAYLRGKLKPRWPPHDYPSAVDVLRAVSDGFCQGMVADLPILAAVQRSDPDLYGPIAGQIATHEHWGAVFQKGSRLRGPVSDALAALVATGTAQRLAVRWFGPGWDKVPTLR